MRQPPRKLEIQAVSAPVPLHGIAAVPLRVWLGAAFLSTGAALAIHIVAGISFVLAILAAIGVIVATVTLVWGRLPLGSRAAMRQRVLIGAATGLAATAAYDLSRLIAVTLVPMTFWPFETLSIFGRLILGSGAPPVVATLIGTLFHLSNGVGFAIAFTLLVQRPTIIRGLIWAAGLELLMVSLYPGWLNLKALDEFAGVSVVGHAAYGVTLGLVGRSLLARAGLLPSQRRTPAAGA